MRLVARVFTVLGALVLAAGVVVALVGGAGLEMVWLLIGPTPFYLVGVWLCRRRPENTVGLWVLICAITFLVSLVIGEQIASLVADRPWGWVPWMVAYLGDRVSLVGGVVIFGLFPDGQPHRTYESRVLLVVVGMSLLTAALYPITQPVLFVDGYPGPDVPLSVSPFYVPATAFASGVVDVVDSTLPIAVLVVAVVLLVLRYRRTNPTERRRIRWLVLGVGSALVSWAILTALAGVVPPGSLLVAAWVFWPMGVVLALGSIVVAVAYDGLLGIDEPVRRTVVYRALWTLIGVLYVGAATALGLTAAEFLPVASAVLLVAGAALLFQPLQRRLERLADRWVFGNRLDGYRVLTRFGAALESAPNSAELLPALAAAVRDGLGLDWVRVCLAPGLEGTAGDAGGQEPVLVVPLQEGWIDCGARRDGELVDEDRRLLQQLAGQAAPAVRNLHLTAELTGRLATIRRQAGELAASRARVAEAQDAERRRIQRDLHDGVQQDVVVLTARLAMARERLRRGDDADVPLAELQADLGRLLGQVREFAHTIHPPVLADQGLLEAVEAQAARLPMPVVIEADAALRGVRYPRHVEAATWYVVSEALTNAVKHSAAQQVRVTLRQPGGRLLVEIRDDGRGFDPDVPRGLGLTGLADRVEIARGTLRLVSRPGGGTTLCAEIPVGADA